MEKLGLGCLALAPPAVPQQTIPSSLTPTHRPSWRWCTMKNLTSLCLWFQHGDLCVLGIFQVIERHFYSCQAPKTIPESLLTRWLKMGPAMPE